MECPLSHSSITFSCGLYGFMYHATSHSSPNILCPYQTSYIHTIWINKELYRWMARFPCKNMLGIWMQRDIDPSMTRKWDIKNLLQYLEVYAFSGISFCLKAFLIHVHLLLIRIIVFPKLFFMAVLGWFLKVIPSLVYLYIL